MSTDAFFAAYDALLGRWPVPVTALDVPTGYGTTRVNVCGPEDAPPLVLLHGGRTASPYWFANVGHLSREHRVYALDTMGDPGRSVNDRQPVRRREDLMSWLDETLSGLALDSADVCGHSFGAWLTLAYGLHAPKRVRRLVLLDPTQCFAGFKPACLMRAAISMLPGGSQTKYLTWETGGAPLDAGWLKLQETARDVPTAKLIAGKQPEARPLAELDRPVLVLLAERSRVHDIAKVADHARRSLPDVTVAILPGVSHHLIPFGHADALNQQIADFLG